MRRKRTIEKMIWQLLRNRQYFLREKIDVPEMGWQDHALLLHGMIIGMQWALGEEIE